MQVLLCSSEKPLGAIVEAAEGLHTPCLLLSTEAIKGKTGLELEAAFCLAARAFEGKGNISSKLSNEALLFLAREMNFASALRRVGAKKSSAFALVCEKSVPLARLKKELGLTGAKKIALSRMGKRKGAYFEGELAVEQMALARARN
jgi:tRNA threonylcarbamoyladenosine modification (KEOPS) complex Cgi121 subunit